jgi:hypothetical protein
MDLPEEVRRDFLLLPAVQQGVEKNGNIRFFLKPEFFFRLRRIMATGVENWRFYGTDP